MAKSSFQQFLPGRDRIHGNRILRIFGQALHSPNLWHFNRRSVLRATVNGLFWTFVPMPFQTIPSTACAILFRANLPLTLLLVWLTNPITFPPILWACYHLGRVILRTPPVDRSFNWTFASVREHLAEIWEPLYVGATLVSVVSAILGYIVVKIGWRYQVSARWKRRALTRASAGAIDRA